MVKISNFFTHQLLQANVYRCAKFHQNWSNISKDTVKVWIFHQFGMKTLIRFFQLGAVCRLGFWNSQTFFTRQLRKANMHPHAKFYKNWWNVSKDTVKVWRFYAFGRKMLIRAFFRCSGVKCYRNGWLLHCHPSMNAITWNCRWRVEYVKIS